MKKFLIATLIASLFFMGMTLRPLQPTFYDKTMLVMYDGKIYTYSKFTTGLAGYKTIDEPAVLIKTTFVNGNDRIHMIQIESAKEYLDIVGFGINVGGETFAIEDTDCDGIYDTYMSYNAMVFPPDCFHPEQEAKDALKIQTNFTR